MHLIVGVDPGTTTGLAVIDYNGRVVDLYSSKNLGLDKAVEHIVPLGTVSVIATDVCPAPDFVLRLATKVGAIVYTPRESVSIFEKTSMTRSYPTGDAHQRDALAAALGAYGSYRNKFAKIDSLGLGSKSGEVKHLVLKGLSIDKARESVMPQKTGPPLEKKPAPCIQNPASPEQRASSMLEKQNRALREHINSLENEIKSLKNTAAKTKREFVTGLKRDSELSRKDMNIRSLMKDLTEARRRLNYAESLKRLWSLAANGDIVPVGVFPEEKKGMILIRKGPKESDLAGLKGVEIAFAGDEETKRLLKKNRIPAADISHVKFSAGAYYILSADAARLRLALKAQATDLSLENIVEGYRKDRV